MAAPPVIDKSRDPGTTWGGASPQSAALVGGTRPGMASTFHRIMSEPDQEYEPPAWSRTIGYHVPTWGQMAQQSPAQPGSAPQAGFPVRMNLDLMGEDPLGQVAGPLPPELMVGLGAQAGEQRGGFYRGLATAPITLANFPTYGREGAIALLTSVLGSDYQQPTGDRFGQEAPLPQGGGNLVDQAVGALRDVGNIVNTPFQMAQDWWRDSNNANRAKQVRELAATGQATPFLVDWAVGQVFPGERDKYTLQKLYERAQRDGVDVVGMLSDAYDLSPAIVSQIMSNPNISDEQIGELIAGQPISLDPTAALASEGLFALGTFAVGGLATGGLATLARGAGVGAGLVEAAAVTTGAGRAVEAGGMAGRIGAALGRGALGTGEALGAVPGLARGAGMAAGLTRGALKANALMTASGWTIRGLELGTKQIAGMLGNQDVVDMMDRLLWQMPLSMNPGLNLIDGFGFRVTSPVRAARVLSGARRAENVEVGIGRGLSDVGAIGTGPAGRYVRIGGTTRYLDETSPVARTVVRLSAMGPEELHASFFDKVGWSLERMDAAFGPGNPRGLTWDDARNTLLYLALQAVRDAKGELGRFEGQHLPDIRQRSDEFFARNAEGALRALDDEFAGRSTAMSDLVKGQFWTLDKLNDSDQAAVKARLRAEYIPDIALHSFLSWTAASKKLRDAIAAGEAPDTAVLRYRRTVNLDYVAAFRQHLADAYQPGQVVSASDIEMLKQYGGAVESTGKGSMLRRRAGKPREYTRSEVEDILSDVEGVAREHMAGADRGEAAAFRPGRTMGDAFEESRVLGIATNQLDAIRRAQDIPTEQLPPPPRSILEAVARATSRTADEIAAQGPQRAWQDIFAWMDERLAQATDTAWMRDRLTEFGQSVATIGDETLRASATRALRHVEDEVMNPLTPRHRMEGPAKAARWDRASEDARLLASDIEAHMAKPERRLSVVASGDQRWASTSALPGDVLLDIDAMARRLAASDSPAVSQADRALMAADVHPLSKLDALQRSVGPRDEAELAQALSGAAIDSEGGVAAVVGDMRAILGADEGVPPDDVLAQASAAAESFAREADELAARAVAVADLFRKVEGVWSEETDGLYQRMAVYQQRRNAAGGRYEAMADDLDPAAQPQRLRRQALREAEAEHARAKAALDEAQATLGAAGRGKVTWQPAPGRMPDGTPFATIGRGSSRRWPKDAKLAEANRRVNDIRARTGQPAQATYLGNGVYEVQVGRYGVPDPVPQPVRGTPEYDAAIRAQQVSRSTPAVAFDDLDASLNLLKSEADDPLAGWDVTASVARGLPQADDAYLASLRARIADRQAVVDASDTKPSQAYQEALASIARAIDAEESARTSSAPRPVVDDRLGVEGSIETAMREGDVAASQAENVAVGVERGGTPESGGAIREDPVMEQLAIEAAEREAGVQPAEGITLYGNDAPFQDPRTETRRLIPSRLRVMEADDITTSWDEGFTKRGLQPRDTSDPSSMEAVRRMGRAPDERLFETSTGAEGTPVVGPDGVALAGNHRTQALRIAEGSAYETYRGMLLDRAEALGLDPAQVSAMRRPILVREVPEEFLTTEMARALNQPTGGMGITELAGSLARDITPDDLVALDLGDTTALADALTQARNVPFVRRIMGKLTERQRNEYLDKGDLNLQGRNLLAAAVISKVLGEGSGRIVGRLVEATDGDLGYIGRGITEAAGQVAVAERGSGLIGDALAQAADLVLSVKGRRGLTPQEVDQLLAGGILDDVSPEVTGLARSLLGMRSYQEVRTFLRGYAARVPDPAQVSMFDEGDVPLHALLNAGIDAVNRARSKGAQDTMFGADELARIPSPEGTTVHATTSSGGSVVAAVDVPVFGTVDDAIEARGIPFRSFRGDDLAAALRHAPEGPFSIVMDSPFEADRLRRFLAGDDSAWDLVVRVEQDGTAATQRTPPPPEWVALRERAGDVTVKGPDDALDGPTLVSRKPVDVDPDFAANAGFAPDMGRSVRDVQAAIDSGQTVVVSPSDPVTQAVAQTAIGAPRVRQPAGLLVINEPDTATMLRLAQDEVTAAQARYQAASEGLARVRAEAEVPDGTPLDATTLALWDRYVGGESHPATMGGVFDVLESIDSGFAPVSSMSDAEVVQLRNALLAASHRRLDGLGADRTNRAGRPFQPDPDRISSPSDLAAELRAVDEEIQRRITTDDSGPLDGWEGTQYEVVPSPRRYGPNGEVIAPRILPDDYLSRLDEIVPGIEDEILTGRKATWRARVDDSRGSFLVRALDMAFGARREADLTRQAIDGFTEELLAHLPDGAQVTDVDLSRMRRDIKGALAHVRERMTEHTAGWGGFLGLPSVAKYRRIGAVPREQMEAWFREGFADARPEWLDRLELAARESGQRFPIAEAWRANDNRIRGFFRNQDGPIARWVESVYAGRFGQAAHDQQTFLGQMYGTFRFALDARWLALEKIDALMLALGKEGIGAVLEARRMGPEDMPLIFGVDDLMKQRTEWQHHLGMTDYGGWNRTRERYVMVMMKRRQGREFPAILKEMAGKDPLLAEMIRASGDTPDAWLAKLSRDHTMMAERGRYHPEPEMRARLDPYLKKGTISQKEYDDALARGYWTDIPALDAEIANAAGTAVQPLLERLAFLNQQYWQDSASLIFGQVDRSNMQRLFNHPMLYWPLSYQVKATKWLGSVLFQQMGGYQSGALGAVTLGMLHEQHKEWMRTVPGYGTGMGANKNLMFFAQMLLPITPWDIGVSLSPFTRLAWSFVSGDESYARNLFGVGPGYTYFEQLPRVIREQSQPGSLLQGVPFAGEAVRRAQGLFPFRVGVDPVGEPAAASGSQAADAALFGGTPIPPDRQQPYPGRFGP